MATITKRGGKYRTLIRMQGINRRQTFVTKSAARTWATCIEAGIDQTQVVDRVSAKGWTIADLIDRYTADLKKTKQRGRSKEYSLEKLKHDIGDRPASTFGVDTVLDYGRARVRAGAGGVTVGAEIAYLGAVLRHARHSLRLAVDVNATAEARSVLANEGAVGRSNERSRRPTSRELKRLHDYFNNLPRSSVPMADIINFAIYSAMRVSEICRIRWDDLDHEKRTVIIKDRKHPQKKQGNHQTIPLLNGSYEIAANQLRTVDPCIFPFNARSVSAAFTRACKALGIVDLHLHDLRHHGISILFEQGYQIQEVGIVSGYSSWIMLKRYSHIKPESLHRKMQRVDGSR